MYRGVVAKIWQEVVVSGVVVTLTVVRILIADKSGCVGTLSSRVGIMRDGIMTMTTFLLYMMRWVVGSLTR